MLLFIWKSSNFQHLKDSLTQHVVSEMSGGGILLTSNTNLRPRSPGSELHSPSSIWMGIVQVWIHSLPESLLHINEPNSEGEKKSGFLAPSSSALLLISNISCLILYWVMSEWQANRVYMSNSCSFSCWMYFVFGACVFPHACGSCVFWLAAVSGGRDLDKFP